MTKKMLIAIGLLNVLMSTLTPFLHNTLWSFFVSDSTTAALIHALVGLVLIIFATVPEIRTPHLTKTFGAVGALGLMLVLISVFDNRLRLLDSFVYSMVAIFALLGSLELPATTDTKFVLPQVKHFKVGHSNAIRHAH